MKKVHLLLSFASLLLCLSCFAQSGGTIINKYAAILDYQPCNNILIVDSANNFNVGDTVLMIQMKGAVIDTSNTASFGNVIDYKNAGNYEYNVIKSKTGNNLSMKYVIVRNYDIPTGKVQLVRVPYYQNYTIAQALTCMPWNGTKGGVLAMNVSNTLTFNDNIDVSGTGFRGGQILLSTQYDCNKTDYYYPSTNNDGAQKGEGIAEISDQKMYGRGALANGGGGGNTHNGGGGGGGNAGTGGLGGNQYNLTSCNTTIIPNIGGLGGNTLTYSTTQNRIFLGGGGGAGNGNDLGEKPGAAGGGIVIINANSIVGNSKSINAGGANAIECTAAAPGCQNDGTGGGGGGGAILLQSATYSGNLNVNANGGKGANVWMGPTTPVGPGGGGAGGAIMYSQTIAPATTINAVTGGLSGVLPQFANTSYGAQPGQAGQILTNWSLIFPTDTFSNLHPDFTYNRIGCFTFNFINQSSGSITSQVWNFGDGTNATQSNPTHAYLGYGTFNISLVLTGSSGCSDSISKTITIPYIPFAIAYGDTSVCGNIPIQLNATGGTSYQWIPSSGLSNPNIANPIANINTVMTYKVIVTDSFGCTDADSVMIHITPAPVLQISPDSAKICGEGSIQLDVTGVTNPQWSPANTLSNAQVNNPVANPNITTTYTVTGNASNGCQGSDSITVFVYNNPIIIASADNDTIICTDPIVKLHATGGDTYIWSPANLLYDSTMANPTAIINGPTNFVVSGTDMNGCSNKDSVMIYISDNKVFFIPNAFSPNGDGLNDIFLPKYQCDLILESFSIYNRFGQRVFFTTNKFKGWNGFQNSKDADMGTYFWYIQGQNAKHETITRKGDLVLIR